VGVVVGLVAGAMVSAWLWRALRATFSAPVFARKNHRGANVPVGAGIVLVLALVLVSALAFLVRSFALSWGPSPTVTANADRIYFLGNRVGGPTLGNEFDFLLALVAAAGFGLLGLFDDLGASGDDRGFRGHLGAMAKGRLTTGGVKLVFGGLLAVALAASLDGRHPGRVAVDALLIALAANLGNLFDRAPGRTTKVALIATVPLLVAERGGAMTPIAIVIGAGAGLLVFDLREELMLGDTGANVLGAVLALGAVEACSFPVRIGALVVVVLLNLASELVSFSKVIDRVAPLRALDRLGRRSLDPPPPPADAD